MPTLCRAGYSVRVLAREPKAHQWLTRYPRLQVVQGDVLDADSLQRGMAGSRFVVEMPAIAPQNRQTLTGQPLLEPPDKETTAQSEIAFRPMGETRPPRVEINK